MKPLGAGNPLTPLDLSERHQKVRSSISDSAAVVISDPSNVRWLTGFTGSNGTVYLDHEIFILVTDKRYSAQGPMELAQARSPAHIDISQDTISEIVKHSGRKTIHVDPSLITWEMYKQLEERSGGEVVACPKPLKQLRAQKQKGEIERISLAANIVDLALEDAIPLLSSGVSEKEIATHLDFRIREMGASGNAYQTIVASGENSAFPHAQPTERIIKNGDLVIIDVGAVIEGYRSDMTRTFVIGDPTDQQQECLSVVREAQEAAVRILKPGVPCVEIDSQCRTRIEEAGWGTNFIHGTGHGVGLDIHEAPMINSRSDDKLLAGMVITIEPGVYFTDSFGVRWEDLYEITDEGATQLTRSVKSPQI